MFGRNKDRNNNRDTSQRASDSAATQPDPDISLGHKPTLLPAPRPWPLVATADDYDRMDEATRDIGFTLVVNDFSLATYTTGKERHQMPSLLLHIPAGMLDFADPDEGFAGAMAPVPDNRVLRLWADDLLTISHGAAWCLTIDSAEPFDEAWLDIMFPTVDAEFQAFVALIMVSFEPLARGAVAANLRDLDPTHPMAHARIEDHRTPPPA